MLTIADPYRPRSGVAGYPLPMTSIKLIDENGVDLPLGEGLDVQGEIVAKGPQLMTGYWNDKDFSEESVSIDGFLRTGDIGTIDSDGLLTIVDRKKDTILRSGFQVFPSEVEQRTLETGLVIECAAVGKKNGESGESVVLFVVPKHSNLSKSNLQSLLEKSLTNYKRPSEIIFVSELPKSPVGKILRRKVRELL